MRLVQARARKERHTYWVAVAVCHRRSAARCKRLVMAAEVCHSHSTHYTGKALDTLAGCYNRCTPAEKARSQQEEKPDRHFRDYKVARQRLDHRTKTRRTAWAE